MGDFHARIQYLKLCSEKLDIDAGIKKILLALYFYFDLYDDLVKKVSI